MFDLRFVHGTCARNTAQRTAVRAVENPYDVSRHLQTKQLFAMFRNDGNNAEVNNDRYTRNDQQFLCTRIRQEIVRNIIVRDFCFVRTFYKSFFFFIHNTGFFVFLFNKPLLKFQPWKRINNNNNINRIYIAFLNYTFHFNCGRNDVHRIYNMRNYVVCVVMRNYRIPIVSASRM